MKNIIFTLLIVLITTNAYSQKISNLDYDDIKKETSNKKSINYYPLLLERLMTYDTTLTTDEYSYLYYGFTLKDNYSPYGTPKGQDEFLEIYYAEDYKTAIPLGKKILEENPINIKIIFKMLVCYYALEQLDTARLYGIQYYGFLNAIYNSGDGKSIETAWVVISVPDEYEILADMELENTGQALVYGDQGACDRISIDEKNQKYDPLIKKVFFNVSLPFESMSNDFNEN